MSVGRAVGAGEQGRVGRKGRGDALRPALAMAGVTFGELVGGAVSTEAVFDRSGLGAATVDAVSYRDTPVRMAVVVLAAAAFILVNLIVDLLYPVLDARLRRAVTA